MENIDKIIEKIDNLNDLDDSTIESITNEIHNVKDERIRKNLYSLFLTRVKRYMIIFFDNYSAEEIDKKVNTIVNNLTSSLHFDEQIIKDTKFYTDEIISGSIFDIDNLPNNSIEEIKKDSYINKINNINDLDPEKCAKMIIDIHNNFDEKNKTILIDELGKHYEKLINNNDVDEKDFYDNVDLFYNKLINNTVIDESEEINNNELFNEETKDIEIKKEKEIDIIDKITKSIFEKLDSDINNEIIFNNEFVNLSLEEIKDLIDKNNSIIELNNQKIDDLINNNSKYSNKSVEELNKLIKENNNRLLDIDNEVRLEISKKLNKSYSGLKPDEISELRKKVKINVEKFNEEILKENKIIEEEIKLKNNNFKQELISNIENNNSMIENNNEKLQKELNIRLKDKYKIYTYNELSDKYQKIDKNDKIVDELINELIRREGLLTKEEKKLYSQLMDIKEAYFEIINDTTQKFSKFNNDNDVIEYINNHKHISILNSYENSEELKQELYDDILNSLKKKENKIKIEKKEHNKKIWLKALSGAIGFATGFGLANVAGFNPIGGAIATTKLAVTVVNVWTKKHPEGKVAKFKNNQIEKFETKYPNITNKVKIMKEKLNKDPIKCFVNGMAIGYLAGNLYEQITGETVFEQLKDVFDKGEIIPDNSVAVVDPVPEVPTVPEIDPSEIFLDKGEVVNISKLPQGFISSDSTTPVNVIQKVGEAVEFDRAVTLPDGKVMWHFKQLNGKGYAWFEAEKIQKLLADASKIAGKVAAKTL